MSSGKGLGSPKGKKFINLAYGFGAAIVIVGALMKLMHWPGWDTFLPLGMGAEAILFIIGAFEAPHHEGSKWDWSAVYPQLTKEESPAEILEREKLEKKNGKKKKGKKEAKENKVATPAQPATPVAPVAQAAGAAQVNPASEIKVEVASANMLSEEDMKKWNESLTKISKTADNLTKLSDVGDVSQSYIGKLTNAADAAEKFGQAQNESAELINSSSKQVADNYKTSTEKFDLTLSAAAEQLKDGMNTASDKLEKSITETADTLNSNLSSASSSAAETITQASSTLAVGYKSVTDALSKKLEVIENSTSESGKELKSVSKNLAAINSVYELQLNAINEELKIKESQTATQTNVNDQLSLIQKAVSDAVIANDAYKTESTKLQGTITELNNVYGNMLSSLNS